MSSRYSILYCRNALGETFHETNSSFESPDFDDKDLTELSKEAGDVIYLAEQENVGFIHYEHWRNGVLVRRLKYNDDYSWLSSDGETEMWEPEFLFSAENLSHTLKNNSPELHDTIKACWKRKHIQREDQFPIVALIDFIQILRKYWKLP